MPASLSADSRTRSPTLAPIRKPSWLAMKAWAAIRMIASGIEIPRRPSEKPMASSSRLTLRPRRGRSATPVLCRRHARLSPLGRARTGWRPLAAPAPPHRIMSAERRRPQRVPRPRKVFSSMPLSTVGRGPHSRVQSASKRSDCTSAQRLQRGVCRGPRTPQPSTLTTVPARCDTKPGIPSHPGGQRFESA
jgi:hypothetical protein